MTALTCFKAYDIRGDLNKELNESIAYRIGRAYGSFLTPKTVVLGGDIRLTSKALKMALALGLQDAGVHVLDIGTSGTEEIYFATFYLGIDGGIEVTASHNPINYNGMKLVRSHARPISGDTGLKDIQKLAEKNSFSPINKHNRGSYKKTSFLKPYVDHLMSYISLENFTNEYKIVVNSGNGAAGRIIDEIEKRFQRFSTLVKFIKIHHQPDGNFPNGIPNPLIPERRQDTKNAVIQHGADFGIAFDGDFDRCFLFDNTGKFIDSYYIVGLLAEVFLKKQPGSNIIYDPRLIWNTIDVVKQAGGKPILSKTGHAFIKERMRTENAIYGGEMSAHHYFREFSYCDSGMIPWLLIAELIAVRGVSLHHLVNKRMLAYPVSGEINCVLPNATYALSAILDRYSSSALNIDYTDGISLSFPEWRFNVRNSNTEPIVRLNIESRGNSRLIEQKTQELLAILNGNQ